MKRTKVGGVRLLLLVAATLILVAQVSAEPVATELSDGNVRDQIVKHEQYEAHVSNAIQSQSAETVKIAERERYAAQIGVKSKGEPDSEDQDSEIAALRERLHLINEKLANGDLTDDEIAELRRMKYELEQKLDELMNGNSDETGNSGINTDTLSAPMTEASVICENDDDIVLLYPEYNPLTQLDIEDLTYEIAVIRERIRTINEKLANGDLSEEEIAELRRTKSELEQKLNELMNGNSCNTDGSSDSQASDNKDEKDNRSDVAGSIREIIRSFFGI